MTESFTIIFPVKLVEPVTQPEEAFLKFASFDPLGKPKNATAALRKSVAARDALESYKRCLTAYIPKKNIPKYKFNNVGVTLGVYLASENNLYRSLETMLPLLKEAIYDYIGLNNQNIVAEYCFKRYLVGNEKELSDEYVYCKIQNESLEFKKLLSKEEDVKCEIGIKLS